MAIQRKQRKNQEQGNIYKDLSVRSCAECVCVCVCVFLDVKVSRTDDSIITSMYRKPTFTGRYTPWDSFSATSYKINLVRSLTNRVLPICSPSVIDEELKTLRTIQSKNGYPGYILVKLVARDPPGRHIGARFCPLVLQVLWLGKRTDELVRKANNAIRLAYFAEAVRPVYRTTRGLQPAEGSSSYPFTE